MSTSRPLPRFVMPAAIAVATDATHAAHPTSAAAPRAHRPAPHPVRPHGVCPYSMLLRHPLAGKAGSVSDRADVSSAVILGYN